MEHLVVGMKADTGTAVMEISYPPLIMRLPLF